jgi:hypothetical protein
MKLKLIIDLLNYDSFYNESKSLDIAKGKYQIPKTWKQVRNLFKRI